MSSFPPSGRQVELTYQDQRATVVEVGGGVRTYEKSARQVLDPYPLDAMCDGAHGTALVPWPNRLADGRYSFDGQDYQVPITEVDKRNAIHGFLRWAPWQVVEESTSSAQLLGRIFPQAGYPFRLDVAITYSLGAGGLHCEVVATNRGDRRCPYGTGHHPYLSPGQGMIDDCEVRLEASTRILTDSERQLPTGVEPVEGTEFDFRNWRSLGDQKVDFAFTDLRRDEAGRAWVKLRGPDGAVSALWVDQTYPYIELYTGDTLAPSRRRLGLGAEPMTCPPNAFQTGQQVVVLEPGESFRSCWGAILL
jgi:aldose 1-epimerase